MKAKDYFEEGTGVFYWNQFDLPHRGFVGENIHLDDNEWDYIVKPKDAESLSKQYKHLKKWPDSFEEAMKISPFWGFKVEGNKYMISNGGPYKGYPLNIFGTLYTLPPINNDWLWKGNGEGNYPYKFIKFDSAKDLYLWMAEE